MTKVSEKDLTKVAQFAIYDPMGEDFWVIYKLKGKPKLGVAYFSQNVRGWESERWYLFKLDPTTTPIYKRMMSLKDQAQQCQLMSDFPKESIDIEK